MLQCKYNKLGGKVQNECGHTTYIISAVTRLLLTQGLMQGTLVWISCRVKIPSYLQTM